MSEPRRQEQPARPAPSYARPDVLQRRREARRRTRLARIDLALGVVGALLVLLLSPGFAITGLIALLVLVACLFSIVVERRRRRSPRPRRSDRAATPAAARASGRGAARHPRERPPAPRSRERT